MIGLKDGSNKKKCIIKKFIIKSIYNKENGNISRGVIKNNIDLFI